MSAPPLVVTVRADWDALTRRIGAVDRLDTYDTLVRAYAEPHRAYHTLEHVRDGLDLLYAVPLGLRTRDRIAFAWFFHDAVHVPGLKANESESAQFAYGAALAFRLPLYFAEDVRRLTLVTDHRTPIGEDDERTIVDIDLSILGASPERYARYAQQIFDEYVTNTAGGITAEKTEAFRNGRMQFLESTLLHGRLAAGSPRPRYHTSWGQDRFFAQSEENMRAELARLM